MVMMEQAGLPVGLRQLLVEGEPEVALPGRVGRRAGSVVAWACLEVAAWGLRHPLGVEA